MKRIVAIVVVVLQIILLVSGIVFTVVGTKQNNLTAFIIAIIMESIGAVIGPIVQILC